MINPYYVTGLIDGEGSFTYTKMGGNVYPYFAIKLNISDLPLLEKIKEFFNSGTIYQTPAQTYTMNDRSYTSGAMSFLKIFRMDELMNLVWHFLDYPLEGKKVEAFKVWKEMVMIKAVNRKEDWPKLHELALALSKANGGKIKRPRKKK
ncbi:MAG: LAGLIDADG family homing endonuclease [bacterium]|nr:LAGLIDADG family homing endonuclease [bacterium]